MTAVKKFLASGAVVAALVVATPASAQYMPGYGGGDIIGQVLGGIIGGGGYGSPYGSGYGYGSPYGGYGSPGEQYAVHARQRVLDFDVGRDRRGCRVRRHIDVDANALRAQVANVRAVDCGGPCRACQQRSRYVPCHFVFSPLC